MSKTDAWARALVMLALVTAGEAIFLLAFVFGRLFRPTLLEVFQISNFELGLAYSVYGLVAMAAYFFGGPLADRYPARNLMAAALLATGIGGVVFAIVHTLQALLLLYAWWGLTTILLFWAALIRAVREWGGEQEQGRAYGMLDGGRGLVAAVFATLLLAVFTAMLPEDAATATLEQRALALERMIWMVTGFTVAVAGLVMLGVPNHAHADNAEPHSPLDRAELIAIARMPTVWLQAIIVVCAYVGYKSIDDISLYARDAFGYDAVASATLGTLTFWVRPFAAVAVGYLADRTRASSMMLACFGGMILGNLLLAAGLIPIGAPLVLTLTVLATCVAVYGARGLYFALLGEARVPLARTGTAVGLISVIGYTPDVFVGPLMGWLTDRSPGALGHQHFYASVAAFAALGVVATLCFRRASRHESTPG